MNRKLVFVLLLSAAEVMVGLPQALAAQSVNVSIAGFAYNPAEITISKGTTVIWTQNDAANHTVTSDTGLFDSGNLTTGQTFSLTFNEIGTFKYHCTIHVFMKGRVNVIEMQQRFNISGYKINSTDNNGSGIPDWKIMLLDSTTGMEIANTTTDDTGSYMFMDLANGTYTVTEEMKTGWMNTSQMEQMVTVDGMDVMNVNFSNALMPPQPMFNISGYKINSTNNNGSGIPDWKIMLQNTTTGMEIMNTTTNDTGFYGFMGLANGTYNVTEEMRTGWMNTSPMVRMVTITGMGVMNVNFTNALIPSAPAQDFTADLSGSEEVPPVITSATGQAIFNLNSLHFKLTVSNITNITAAHIHLAPAGQNGNIVVFLYPGPMISGRFDGVLAEGNITEANLTGPLSGLPLSALIDNMTAGNTYVNVHTSKNPAGEIRGQIMPAQIPVQTFNISGYKINNAGGMGIPNWKIMIQNTTTGMEIMNTTTNDTGFYRFMGLANGTYNVTEEMKTGWMNTSPMVQMVTINGIDKSNVNFTNALIPPTGGSISGMKFNDLNNNSAKDTNEPGLGNWTINLKDHNASTVTATTDNNGNYTFCNLTPGNYTVAEVLKTGWIQTFPTNGTYNVTITGNESITGRDFGNNLSVPLPLGVTAVRTIEKEALRSGESTNVTVNISSATSQALSLQEIIPAGWNLTRISDDADAFKNSTNEWIWFSVTPGVNKTAVYRLTAPGNATIGTYYINGTVSNSSGVIAVVQGDNTITLDIQAYYRRLGSDPNRVETTDVLTAIDDWKNSRAPAGFERPITTQELLALIDEWLK